MRGARAIPHVGAALHPTHSGCPEPAEGQGRHPAGLKPRTYVRIGLALIVGSLALSGTGRAQMPSAAQMSGVPLPASDVPNASVVVRLVRGDMSDNIAAHPVELHGGPSVLTVQTDANGRAQFEGLTPGGSVHAVAVVDGQRLESQTFPVPAQGGIRLVLVAPTGSAPEAAAPGAPAAAPPAQPGSVTFSGQSQVVVQLNDDVLDVFYLLQVSNRGSVPASTEPLVLDLPPGARGASILEGSSPLARAEGTRVVISGPFPPGATLAQAAFTLPYSSDSATVTQRFPATLEALSLVVSKVGRMHLESPQVSSHGEMPSEGRTFLVGNGPAIKAGDALTFTITGLPRRAAWPRQAALLLAIVILLAGGWASISIGGRASAEASRRGALQERRDRLFADLVRLEEEHRGGQLGEPRYAARRRELVRQLEQLYGELDGGLAA